MFWSRLVMEPVMLRNCAYWSILLFVAGCSPSSQDPGGALPPPLLEQHESRYVTDSSVWGKLTFQTMQVRKDPAAPEDSNAIAQLVGAFNQAWLSRDEPAFAHMLHDRVVRIRQGRIADGKEAVVNRIRGESRGERPEGYTGSIGLTIRNVEIRVFGDVAVALYRLDIRGGARWEYADLSTVLQFFERTDGGWRIFAHTESMALGDPTAPPVPENVPTRVTPIRFDFVYPVSDLDRAVDFYEALLGPPVEVTDSRASFRVNRAFFELTTERIDDRIRIKPGMANGYAVIDTHSLNTVSTKLASLGISDVREAACENTRCLIAEDPSGNIVVWRELASPQNIANPSPILTFYELDTPVSVTVGSLMNEWMSKSDRVADYLSDDATWIDDEVGVASGTDITALLKERWSALSDGDGGIDGEMAISDMAVHEVDDMVAVSFHASLVLNNSPKRSGSSRIMQLWRRSGSDFLLEFSFMVRAREQVDRPVNGMDYTAYPVSQLGRDGAFYKVLFGSEPYRDDNWFGFWSTSSVFGLVGDYPDQPSYSPVAHTSNGYADLSIGSAEVVYRYLEARGAAFPLVTGINNERGIDTQPGYLQILAVDSEGNLINFSQYLEY